VPFYAALTEVVRDRQAGPRAPPSAAHCALSELTMAAWNLSTIEATSGRSRHSIWLTRIALVFGDVPIGKHTGSTESLYESIAISVCMQYSSINYRLDNSSGIRIPIHHAIAGCMGESALLKITSRPSRSRSYRSPGGSVPLSVPRQAEAGITDHVWTMDEFLLFRGPPWRQQATAT
jgi:hypothetical protein